MSTPDTANTASSPKNSTNGHANYLPIPTVLRSVYAIARRINTRLAGELARLIFLSPPRSPYLDAQHAVLRQADRSTLNIMGHKVCAYSWGSGPTVLLMHGWGGHAGHMTEFVAPLTQAGYRAVAVDAPAHGSSEGRLSSVVHFAAAILTAAETWGPIHGVVAHSFGAAGTVHALRNGLGVNRVVFLAPQASFNGYWQLFRQSLGMADADWQAMTDRSEARLKVSFADVHPAVHAPTMTAPLLVLHGTSDRMVPPSEGRELARLWPDADFRELNAGHLSILRDTRAISAALAFMDVYRRRWLTPYSR